MFRHQDHIDRLFKSAQMYYMDVPFSKEQIREATLDLIARNNLKSCYIRPVVYRGAGPMGLYPLDCPVDVFIAVWEWGSYLGDEGKKNGMRATVVRDSNHCSRLRTGRFLMECRGQSEGLSGPNGQANASSVILACKEPDSEAAKGWGGFMRPGV